MTAPQPKPTYIGLDYLDWSGHGGHHLTAHLTFEDRERVELDRPISVSESKVLYPDHSDRFYSLPMARRTNRFENWTDLNATALRWCDANLKGDYILLKHNRSDLRRVIGARGMSMVRVRMLNLIEEQWDRLTNPERDRATMDAMYAMWREWKP